MIIPQLFMLNVPQKASASAYTAVMFPVAKTKSGTTLMATCAHTIHLIGGQFEMLIFDMNGEQLPPSMDVVKCNILPPSFGADLAFVEVSLDREPDICRVSERSIARKSPMSHARNVIMKDDFPGKAYVISEQVVSPLRRKFHFIAGTYQEASKTRRKSVGQVPVLRELSMQSWHGVSGSPLWDRYGSVRGMVCGGNDELSSLEPEYFLVYLPAKMIKKYLNKFFGGQIL